MALQPKVLQFFYKLWGKPHNLQEKNHTTLQPRFDAGGLLPAVVQDASTGQVLMLAYMNREALELTLQSGETHFWSRSRKELWHKGGTSGNTQQVVELALDCDGDALLVRVLPAGPACHTGAVSCFFNPLTPPKDPTS